MGTNGKMTSRARWQAALRLEPVDRLPFWPKLNGAYPRAQEPKFRKLGNKDLFDWIGSDRHGWVDNCVKEIHARCSVQTTTEDGVQRTVFHTPHGELDRICHFDPESQSWHPMSFPIKQPQDLKLMTEYYDDLRVELDKKRLEDARAKVKEIGETAFIANSIGESPLMHFVEWLAGVSQAHYLLADHPGEVEELFAAIHHNLLRRTEIIAEHSLADATYLVENTSTTLISPAQYHKYCRRHISEYGEIMASFDRLLILHMCGHLKLLLPDLARMPVQAFEAFTSPPVGNTRLADGRAVCPDQCIIGGTNAALWIRPAIEIIAELERDLGVLPHHRGLVVTSAGVMPPLATPQTIKQVCDWVKAYPARM